MAEISPLWCPPILTFASHCSHTYTGVYCYIWHISNGRQRSDESQFLGENVSQQRVSMHHSNRPTNWPAPTSLRVQEVASHYADKYRTANSSKMLQCRLLTRSSTERSERNIVSVLRVTNIVTLGYLSMSIISMSKVNLYCSFWSQTSKPLNTPVLQK